MIGPGLPFVGKEGPSRGALSGEVLTCLGRLGAPIDILRFADWLGMQGTVDESAAEADVRFEEDDASVGVKGSVGFLEKRSGAFEVMPGVDEDEGG